MAFALLALVLASLYPVLIRSLTAPSEARAKYILTEFARSTIDEYVATFPLMKKTGLYNNQWAWDISETTKRGIAKTRFDGLISLVSVTIVASEIDNRSQPVILTRVIARRVKK